MVACFSLSNFLGKKKIQFVVEAEGDINTVQCFVLCVDVFVKELNLCHVQRSAGGHSSHSKRLL